MKNSEIQAKRTAAKADPFSLMQYGSTDNKRKGKRLVYDIDLKTFTE